MSDTAQAASELMPSVPNVVDADNNVDIDAIKEFSAAQRAKRHEVEKAAKRTAPKEEEETEDTLEAESSEDGESDNTEDGDDDEQGSEEESSEEDEEGLQEVSESEQLDKKQFVYAKAGGKTLKIPKGAVLPVLVDGKTVEMPVQEVLNKASGAQFLDQKISAVDKREKAASAKEASMRAIEEETSQKLEILHEACQSGTPEQVVELYCLLAGKDPNKALEGLVANALQYAEEFAGLTERERAMLNENRRFKFSKILENKKAEKQTAAEKQRLDQQAAKEILEAEGLGPQDWIDAAEEIKGKLVSGELNGKFDAKGVAEYALKRSHQIRIKDAVKSVTHTDSPELVSKISNAVLKTESISGERMTPAEILQLVKAATNASLSESVERKVARAAKAGAIKSKNVSPQKQGTKKGAFTLSDHWDRINGIE